MLFEDQRDFEEAQRGFLAAPEYKQIMAAAGDVDWDMAYGLYEVHPDRIDQVRGFDLANMTIIKGQTGWVR